MDSAVFYQPNGNIIILVFYVDNIFIIGYDEGEVERLQK
jgi:hypothetical protein